MLDRVSAGPSQRHCDRTATQSDASGVDLREVVAVPVSSLRTGESPRREGEDKTHIARLAQIDRPLPPILVDRRSMRVIDGMHRLMAARLRGQATINVRYFDGNENDAFLQAVKANVAHGLPLSLADRRAAAARIVSSHPHMSDRSICEMAGLSNKTVGAIRRSASALAQPDARVGKDGKVQPLNGAPGRERAAALIAMRPGASLREVARDAGISPGTVRDVRRRLESGEQPGPARRRRSGDADGHAAGQAGLWAPDPAALLDMLRRDPSLRYHDQGRRLLNVLQLTTVMAQEWTSLVNTVQPHSVATVQQLARQCGRMWLRFAQDLHDRQEVTIPDGSQGTAR